MPQEGITIMLSGYIEPKDGQQAEETQGKPADTATVENETEEKKGAGELVD